MLSLMIFSHFLDLLFCHNPPVYMLFLIKERMKSIMLGKQQISVTLYLVFVKRV